MSHGNITKFVDDLVGRDRYKDAIRRESNIGASNYLDQLPANVRGPSDTPVNEQKGWASPEDTPRWQLAAFPAAALSPHAPMTMLLAMAMLVASLLWQV